MCKLITILFSVALILSSCYNRDAIVDKKTLIGNDFRHFQGTPVWVLAKAVEDEDVGMIKRLVVEKKLPVDFQDTIFGNTLLMMSVSNGLYKSTKTLLELGADPNLHDKYKGANAVIDASHFDLWNDGRLLKLVLKYGGDPNSEENAPYKNDSTDSGFRSFALLEASKQNLSLVKLLVEAGANVNQTDKQKNEGALENAIIQEHYDVALYLLQHGVDYNKKIAWSEELPYINILHLIRLGMCPLGSSEHKDKLKVIAFLKQKGLDYGKYPIPEWIVERVKKDYPNKWEEYLEKY